MDESFRVLVVDDDKRLLSLIQRMLSRLGGESITASSSDRALDEYTRSLKSSPFDLILLDLYMPRDRGARDLINEMSLFNSKTKAIVMSGSRDLGYIKLDESGFCQRLAKPFTIEDLWRVIFDVLGEKKVKKVYRGPSVPAPRVS